MTVNNAQFDRTTTVPKMASYTEGYHKMRAPPEPCETAAAHKDAATKGNALATAPITCMLISQLTTMLAEANADFFGTSELETLSKPDFRRAALPTSGSHEK